MRRRTKTPTLELVLKRNSVERLKRDKSPLGMLDELPALIAQGYEQVDEEDIVRLKWWGLYHDKPKIGTFMLRVKIPGGITSPEQLRAIGEISNVHGRGSGELSTRQNVQLHYISSPRCPTCSSGMHAVGAHLRRRVRRHGAQHHRLPARRPRARRALRPDAGARRGGGVLLRQPGLLRPAAQAEDRDHGVPRRLLGARDQLHRADRRDQGRREGFGVLVGGGLSSVPRIAQDLGIWVAKEEAVDGARGDPRRVARGPALPRLARQVAAQVHDRRHRPGGHARAESSSASAARSTTSRCRTCRRRTTTSACTTSPTAGTTSASRCTSGSSPATRWSRSPTSPRASAATSA